MNGNICLHLEDLLLLGETVPVWNRGFGNCGVLSKYSAFLRVIYIKNQVEQEVWLRQLSPCSSP
jgi:hypothetical protein